MLIAFSSVIKLFFIFLVLIDPFISWWTPTPFPLHKYQIQLFCSPFIAFFHSCLNDIQLSVFERQPEKNHFASSPPSRKSIFTVFPSFSLSFFSTGLHRTKKSFFIHNSVLNFFYDFTFSIGAFFSNFFINSTILLLRAV